MLPLTAFTPVLRLSPDKSTVAIEAAGKLQGLYTDTQQVQPQDKFSIRIVIPQIDAKPPMTLDVTPERHSEASGAPVPLPHS